ncbi:MAG: two-component regulator propeller domain-containing protein, partial [Saprospiraceae bacterium]
MNFQKKHFSYSVFILLYLTLSVGLSAQSIIGNFTQYTEKDGLPGAEVSDLLVDKQGYIWIGTVNGLARYDGYSFKRFYFNPNDTNTIHGLTVWSLFEDRKGQIWVGTGPSFLNKYSPLTQQFVQYKFTHLVPHLSNTEIGISEMEEDNNGRMYFGIDTYYSDTISTALLYKEMNEDVIKAFPVPDSLYMQNVFRLKKDLSGNIWIFSYTGLFKIDPEGILSRVRLLDNELILKNDYLRDIGFDSKGHLWLFTHKFKLYEIDPGISSYKLWNVDKLYKSFEAGYWFRTITIDKNDNIWLGTLTGLVFFNRVTNQFEDPFTGIGKELGPTVIRDLKFDNFGTLWIATNAAGLLKYEEGSLLRSYSYNKDDKNSFTSGWANNICETSDGKVWVATSGSSKTSGLSILDTRRNTLRPITFDKIQSRINGISAFWENKPGEMYIAVNNLLYNFSDKTLEFKPVRLPGLSEQVYINSYLKDSRQNEWLFTFSGIYKKPKGDNEYKLYDLSKVIGANAASNEVTRGFESKKHGLWILTNSGLFLYDYNTDKIERLAYDKELGDILVTQDVNSLYEGPDGMVWVGTWQGGLSKYTVETKKIKTYTRNDGLPSMSIQGILADEKNKTLWLSTFEGLSRFNLTTEQFNNFTIADGLQGQLFADGSYLKTSDGLFIFGGSNGITIFNPDEVNKNSIPPKVFLTDLKVSNKSVLPGEKSILKKAIYETDEIDLAYNQNSLSLEFIALHYSDASKNKYSYKLENYDDDWRDAGTQRTAYYSNLPPGKYIFHVKAANDKGVWNEQGVSLKMLVHPPWWKTTTAYILYAIFLLITGFAVDRIIRRRLIEREKEKNRVRELEQAKEIQKAYYKLEEAHESLKATQNQLIQSEKMASLGELTAGIAHEIQNPLNFVNNFSDVNTELLVELKGELTIGNKQQAIEIVDNIKQNEEKINHHGKRAESIVKGMLQHSKKSTGTKEPTDINALADEYMRLSYHGQRAKDKTFNAEFKLNLDPTMPLVNVIPQDIGRVLLNLFNNAFWAVNEKSRGLTRDEELASSSKMIDSPTDNLAGLSDDSIKDQRGLSNDYTTNFAGS